MATPAVPAVASVAAAVQAIASSRRRGTIGVPGRTSASSSRHAPPTAASSTYHGKRIPRGSTPGTRNTAAAALPAYAYPRAMVMLTASPGRLRAR
ncbi:hypothetical protein Dfulv_26940 [Dactylosporangium fulvum]|uniref:Secreted protein n=1 Tax=Dactylosporangium fulvum TaxID=53359 RepID=A0ABY5VNU5_9ACTN|nr:hypothetical protein [Dactylosporangium fulvum]UWP78807.1 hypothetical protein Dfulv_26940 [Dactylosporangium fulvum]